jgi:hypothetical protein
VRRGVTLVAKFRQPCRQIISVIPTADVYIHGPSQHARKVGVIL